MNLKKNLTIASALTVLVAASYFGFGAFSQSQIVQAETAKESNSVSLDSDKALLGYTLGSQIGRSLAQDNMLDELDLDAFLNGIRDLASGKESKVTPEQMVQAQQAFQLKRQQEFASMSEQNLQKGEAFLEKNKLQDGVVITESGLHYNIEREGKGKEVTATDKVKIHYLGTLIDGTPFDSSYARNEPVEFPVTGVIPGFSEGLKLMKEGGKYRFVIPSALAYGKQAPPSIGPNQVLIFEVELIEVL